MARRINLPFTVKIPIIACGADLKGAFALAGGREAIFVDGFGDLSQLDNFDEYVKSANRHIKTSGIRPLIAACDLHPDYFSTRYALSLGLKQVCRVQHHEAHILSAAVDNGIDGEVVGVAFDGTGYGRDGRVWGGEFFAGTIEGLRRMGHLEYVAMPGADFAVREPWRMAASFMFSAYGKSGWPVSIATKADSVETVKLMIEKKINSPLSSSAGRLFDAAASIILGKGKASQEAELPVSLEKICSKEEKGYYRCDISNEDGVLIVKTPMIIRQVSEDIRKGCDNGAIAAKFHNTIANIITDVSMRLCKLAKTKRVILSGGVFQNAFLLKKASDGLRMASLEPICHRELPANDSSIPIGQMAIANEGKLCV